VFDKDSFVFQVERWTKDGRHIEQTLALAANLSVGRGAYEAACRQYPDAILTFRSGARVVERQPEERAV
jgi:hypothetical protein